MKHLKYLLLFLLFALGCKENKTSTNRKTTTKKEPMVIETGVFPEVKNVNTLEQTDFVPTLESSFETKKNIIYGATFPMAWNEIREILGGNLSDFESRQLEEVNSTKSYLNVLKESEYSTSVSVEENRIRAKAYFRKSLPFIVPLTKFDSPLKFQGKRVESFGFLGESHVARINYFNSNEDFSISLKPKNFKHEIILITNSNITQQHNFIHFFKYYNQQIKLEKNRFITFSYQDKVEIPIVEFNLDKNFDSIIGSTLLCPTRRFYMTEAYQRNAFILNEKGAEVESYTDAAGDAIDATPPKPKKIIFNKPFVIFLKRKDAKYPYFATFISNTELLKEVK